MKGDDLRKVEFREKMRGYHPEDVDRLLERIAVELDNRRSPEGLLSDVSFREKMRGYNPSDVDAFLDRVRANVATGVKGEGAREAEPQPSLVPDTVVFDFDTSEIKEEIPKFDSGVRPPVRIRMRRKGRGHYQLVRDDGWTLAEIRLRGKRLSEVSVGGRTFRPRFRLGHYAMLSGVYDTSTGASVLSVPRWHPKGQSGTVLQLADGRKFSFATSGDLMTASDDSGRRVMTFEVVANPDGSPARIPEVSLPRERPLLNDELLVLIAVVFSLLKH